MRSLPKKISLSTLTASAISDEINTGRWDQWLPGEHELAAQLHVSRRTVREALEQLRRDGVVKCNRGKRRQIVQRNVDQPKPASCRVVLLTPVPLHSMSPFSIFLIDRLREHLAEDGYLLEIHVGRDPYRARLPQRLKKLEETLHPAGWVLMQSTEAMQRWFAQRRLCCVVVGSCYPRVELASVGFDFAAVCRHAVGQFLARGHRRIVLLNPKVRAAGDMKAEAGFLEAIKSTRVENVAAEIVHHDGTVRNICSRLDGLLRMSDRPTALLISRGHHVLTVLGHLSVCKLRVPEDMTIISREDDSYLESVVPSLTRYSGNPELFATKLSRVVLNAVRGDKRALESRIMPTFIPGETLGRL
jgi:DNA-binding LacI/PurR family transcriptional regulator